MATDNTGTIRRNKNKKDDKDRDALGSATIGGVEYWISGWTKAKDGEQFLSMTYKPKEVLPQTPETETTDDLPW